MTTSPLNRRLHDQALIVVVRHDVVIIDETAAGATTFYGGRFLLN